MTFESRKQSAGDNMGLAQTPFIAVDNDKSLLCEWVTIMINPFIVSD